MSKNIQVRALQKFHKAFSSLLDTGAPPKCVVHIGIASHDELCFPAMAVVDDVPHFLGWWWFM
jgi:hypothetical protein